MKPDLRGYVARLFGPLSFVALARFAVAFQGEGCYECGSTLWEVEQADAEVVLFEFYGSVGAVHCYGADLVQQVRDYDGFAGPVVDVRVERVAAARVAQIVATTRLARIRKTNRVAVFSHPVADG